MPDQQDQEFEGVVLENLPNTTFRVQKQDGGVVLCTLSGRMRLNRIRVMPGDKVRFIVSSYDKTRGRITYRIK